MALPGVKDFLAMQTEVFADVHNTDDLTTATFPALARIKQIINDEDRKLCAGKEWMWVRRERTITMVDGTSVYTLDADVRKVGNIMREETVGLRVNFMPRQNYENAFPKGDIDAPAGRPRIWTPVDPDVDNAFKVKFRNIPGPDEDTKVLKFTAFIRPPAMINDVDIPIYPEEFQDIVLGRVKSRCFRILDDTDNELRYKQDADELEKEAWKEHMNQPGWVDEFKDIYAERGQYYEPGAKEPLWFT